MPYIKKEKRSYFDDYLISIYPETCGELNYCFTKLIKNYIQKKGVRYQTYNDIIGALEGTKLELYRREISAYENEKIQENGDVY